MGSALCALQLPCILMNRGEGHTLTIKTPTRRQNPMVVPFTRSNIGRTWKLRAITFQGHLKLREVK